MNLEQRTDGQSDARTEYSHQIRPVSYQIDTRNVFEMYAN